MRAVLDPNVLISALLSGNGAPAQALRGWRDGQFDLIVSPLLLGELERALAYPRLRTRITENETAEFVAWLATSAELVDHPADPPSMRSQDPHDDYLLALAASAGAALVSGDRHLLKLAGTAPVFTSAEFLDVVAGR